MHCKPYAWPWRVGTSPDPTVVGVMTSESDVECRCDCATRTILPKDQDDCYCSSHGRPRTDERRPTEAKSAPSDSRMALYALALPMCLPAAGHPVIDLPRRGNDGLKVPDDATPRQQTTWKCPQLPVHSLPLGDCGLQQLHARMTRVFSANPKRSYLPRSTQQCNDDEQ